MYKKIILCTLLLCNTSFAETRFLNEKMEFCDNQQDVRYKIELKKTVSNIGWMFSITGINGDRVASGQFIDLQSNDLFSPINIRGEYTTYNSNTNSKLVEYYDQHGKIKGPVYEYKYTEYGEKYTERLERVFHYDNSGASIDDKIIYNDGSSLIFLRDKEGNETSKKRYDKDNILKEIIYNKKVNAIEYVIIEEYDLNKKLKKVTKKHSLKKEGAWWGYKDTFDANGRLLSQTVNDYEHEPASKITYGPDKKIRERRVYSHYTNANLYELFDDQGNLLERENIDENAQKQGLQLFEMDGEVISKNYKDGQLDGLSTNTRNSRIVSSFHYKRGMLVGKGYNAYFLTDADGKETDKISNIHFFEYDNNAELVSNYTVDDNFITWEKSGKPVFESQPKDFSVPTLKLGVMSLYSYGSENNFMPLVLESINKDVATYKLMNQNINMQISTHSIIDKSRQGTFRTLQFPLRLGKRWKDSWEMPIESTGGRQRRYQYTGESTSQVVGLRNISVAAGKYDALVIQRVTKWTKSKPVSDSSELQPLKCETEKCAISGYTQEYFWYAPELGSVVLKAVEETEDSKFLSSSSERILQARHAIIIELVYQGMKLPGSGLPQTKFARISSDPYWGVSGFILRPNDTWEYMMASDYPITARLPQP